MVPVGRCRVAAVCSMALLLAHGVGCSWISVTKPPPGPIAREPPVQCTTSLSAPVADTVIGGLLLAGGVTTIAISEADRGRQPCSGYCSLEHNLSTGAGAILAMTAIPLAFSAIHGYSATADCRNVREAQLSCVSGVEASCQQLREHEW